MSDHDGADDASERPRFVSGRAVGTAALLGFNLVLVAWSLRRLPLHVLSVVPSSSPQHGVGDTIFLVFLYGTIAAVAVGHLWFMARMMRLCGTLRPVSTLLVGIAVSVALVLFTGVLLWPLLEPDPRRVAYVFAFPLMGAVGCASVVRFAPRTTDVPKIPRTTSAGAAAGAGMLGVNFVLVTWSSLMFWALSMLGMGMSPRQEPLGLVVSVYCVIAVVVVLQVWFLIRMMRLTGVARPVPMLLLAVGVSIALAFVAGTVLWGLWLQWQWAFGYALVVPLLSILAAVSFGLTVRLAHRTRILLVLAVVATMVIFGGVLVLVVFR
ncbi:hypothetical protein [Haloactinomyces albus]|uniref:Uncharacterized protein n=1 Tax=Haloactinomyces albus TaxID=1352928 RepID=A0AAE4CLR0_9ACTN|nr:hypothetical protein [Haloactinomyces albus]MDR7300192.1 hypothetical protein [Haloactinomyces albus]